MPGKTERVVGANGASQSRYVVLPRSWCEGTGVRKGSRVSVLTNSVLVIVPPRCDRETETVLRLMREGSL